MKHLLGLKIGTEEGVGIPLHKLNKNVSVGGYSGHVM